MKAIIFDLETTKAFKVGHVQHIVEIGAAKVDITERKPHIEDTFQAYVMPEIGISKQLRKYIGMEEEDLNHLSTLQEALAAFLEWIHTDDYYLCSWSKDDWRIIHQQCTYYGLSLSWFKNYNDIQPAISYRLADRKQTSVNKALNYAGLRRHGRLHRALDDAINTAHLFIHCFDHISLEENNQ